MIHGGRILTHGHRNWFRAALQPANLLYVLMIPPLWLALIAMVGLAGRDTFTPDNRLRLIFFAAACVLTALLFIQGYRREEFVGDG